MKSKRRNFRFDIFKSLTGILLVLLMLAAASAQEQTLKLDERPAEPGEWGYRPAAGSVLKVNPPSFSWRPQAGLTWKIQCAGDLYMALPRQRQERLANELEPGANIHDCR